MFDLPVNLRQKGVPHHVVWTYAFHAKDILKYISKDELLKINIKEFCISFENSLPTSNREARELKEKYSAYLTGHLLLGLSRVFVFKVHHLYESVERALERVGQRESLSTVEDITPVESIRHLSPVDFDYDMEGSRANFGDGTHPLPLEDFTDHPFEQPSTTEVATGIAAASSPSRRSPSRKSPARQARKRPPKRVRHASDSEGDEDYGKKRKPRRKPVRKAAVASVARHEDITLRDVSPIMDALEQDLENDLEPLDEAVLGDALVAIDAELPRASSIQPPPDFGDFDYPETVRSLSPSHIIGIEASPSHLIGVDNFPSHQVAMDASPSHIVGIDNFPSHQIGMDASPSRLIGIDQLSLESRSRHGSVVLPIDETGMYLAHASRSVTPAGHILNEQPPRASSIQPPPDFGDFDYPESVRSASPSRLIGIDVLNLRSSSCSRQGSVVPPVDETGLYVAHTSRSVTPAGRTPRAKKLRTPRQPRKTAREPPVSLTNDNILHRDQVYCQKNNFNLKMSKIREYIGKANELYKKFCPNLEVEINDALREKFQSDFTAEHARRATKDQSSVRAASRVTDVASLKSRSRTPKLTPVPVDDYGQDFDYDFRPATPQRAITPLRHFSKSPSRQPASSLSFGDVTGKQYDEIVPLPAGTEHLMSPVRPVPVELLTSTNESPAKELGCNYGHDELYKYLIYHCMKQKKVVFEFDEFARQWPRSFVAKQFHNFLHLIELRKILALSKNGIFHSFLVLPPKDGFVAKCGSHFRTQAVN